MRSNKWRVVFQQDSSLDGDCKVVILEKKGRLRSWRVRQLRFFRSDNEEQGEVRVPLVASLPEMCYVHPVGGTLPEKRSAMDVNEKIEHRRERSKECAGTTRR